MSAIARDFVQPSGIREIVCGLRKDYYARLCVTMLKGFMDDSGSGGDSPWFVLAGYVGTVEGWDGFDSPWRAILDRPPKVNDFHSAEAERLRDQWSGITRDERNAKIDDLIEVIARCAKRAIHVRLRQDDYNTIIKNYVPPQWDNAYYFLFPAFVSAVVSMEKHFGESDPVEFVFDNNERLEKPSLRLYDQFKDLDKFAGRVVNIHYRDDKVFLPLQAADLLAWQIRRRLCVTTESPRHHLDLALRRPPEKPYEFVVTADSLQEMGERMDQDAKEKWAAMGQPETMRPWKR